MEEHQTTVDGVTYQLPKPFLVLATQNPIEYEGTFPLPEGQLDRFYMRIGLGYPSFSEEVEVIGRQEQEHPLHSLEPVITPEEVLLAQEQIKGIFVDGLIRQYIVGLVEATRNHSDAALGASPRGSLGLFRTSQALAFIRGRDFVLPDDVKALAQQLLAHRVIVSPQSRMRGVTGTQIVAAVLEQVPVPGLLRTSQALAFIRGRDFVLPDDVKALAQQLLAHRVIVSPQSRMRGVTGTQIVAAVLEQVPVPGLRSRSPAS
jgi:MoxR-like ATPase